MIHNGDCVEVMAAMPENSVDAIVCDPPYGLEFMGKEWDSFAPQVTTSRVQRTDGGRLDATVSGPTPQQRHKVSYPSDSRLMRCSKCQGWSGSFSAARAKRQKQCICDSPLFTPSGPPSQMVAFQEWSRAWATEAFRVAKPGAYLLAFGGTRTYHRLAVAIEDAGWIIRDCLVWAYASGFPKSKALLKPAWEPIVMARKPGPLRELAIDACRMPVTADMDPDAIQRQQAAPEVRFGNIGKPGHVQPVHNPLGRWPANVLLTSTEDGRAIFDGGVDGVVGGGEASRGGEPTDVRGIGGIWHDGNGVPAGPQYGDTGTYSRFYRIPTTMSGCRYCGVPIAESSSSESATSDTPSGIAPSDASLTPSEPSATPAPTAASPSARTGSSIALWSAGDSPESDAEPRSATPTTNGSGSASSPSERVTTPPTPRSSELAPSPADTSLMASAKSPTAANSGTDTTTTTDGPWTCDTCAALITSLGTSDEPENSLPADYARFYLVPKSARSEREPVFGGLEESGDRGYGQGKGVKTRECRVCGDRTQSSSPPFQPACGHADWEWRDTLPMKRRNNHPTVKPLDLMRHLVRLVTPQGGTVLDPFLGSGTTAIAAEMEGFAWIGIEREPEYVAIAEARLMGVQRGLGLDVA
jgi:DNA modification methylase